MKTRSLLPFAAAAALSLAAPALAQHMAQHGDHGATPAAKDPAAGIAEGTVKNGVRTVELQVTEDGFVPSKVKANKGEKLHLVVTRKTEKTCATEIAIPAYGIKQPLPLEKPVTVELTPKASGEIRYACGMNMVSGVILVP